MAAPQDATFGTFIDGGNLQINDIVVGLRGGLNTRFNFVGEPGIYLPLAGGTMAGAIDMNGNIITGLPAPSASTDAVNKAYVDAIAAGAAMTEVNDTNVTLTLGGTPATSLLQAVSLTLGWTGQLPVARGGTGTATFTAYSLICAGTTATGAFQNVSGVGTANQVLVSNGAAALPTWQNVPGLSAAAMTEVNDTNVTLTLGGTPATSLLQAVSLTLGWTGTLSGTRGGTGVNNGANTATFAGNLNFAAAFSTSGAFAVTQTYTGITNVTFPTTGTLATTSQLATPAALTEVNDTNVTLTLGGTPTTALLQAVSLTLGWSGQLSVARGGTGLAALTAHNLLIGNGTSAATLLAPSATSGVPLISQGASSDPVYGTALVAGGGTGNTTFTAYSVLCAGTTATGAFQNVSGLGSTGNVLTSNGAGALPTWQPVTGSGTVNSGTQYNLAYYAANGTAVSGLTNGGSSGLALLSGSPPAWSTGKPITQIVVQTFASVGSGTYTPTAGMTYCIVKAVGPGGGSAGATGATGQVDVSAGAGAGGYAEQIFTAATIGASKAIFIGTGGTAGTATGNGGNGSAATTFGALLTCNPGAGSTRTGSIASFTGQPSVAGGTASGGYLNVTGGSGSGSLLFAAGIGGLAGKGGASMFGDGGAQNFGNSTSAGTVPLGAGAGAGGSVSCNNAGGVVGAAGANGFIEVTEYISV